MHERTGACKRDFFKRSVRIIQRRKAGAHSHFERWLEGLAVVVKWLNHLDCNSQNDQEHLHQPGVAFQNAAVYATALGAAIYNTRLEYHVKSPSH